MKKIFPVIIFFGLVCSCGENHSGETDKDIGMDSTKKTPEFGGVYTGMIPCADCPGIYSVVEFTPDHNFYENLKYLERNSGYADSGKWTMDDSVISINFKKGDEFRYYKIMNDSTIRMLDAEKEPITGPLERMYILKKKDTVLQR